MTHRHRRATGIALLALGALLAPAAATAAPPDPLPPGVIVGTKDADTLVGTPRSDLIFGLAGADLVYGGGIL